MRVVVFHSRTDVITNLQPLCAVTSWILAMMGKPRLNRDGCIGSWADLVMAAAGLGKGMLICLVPFASDLHVLRSCLE